MSLHRDRPKPLAQALSAIENDWVPDTPLARIQHVWQRAVGEQIASVATPVAERAGVVTIRCEVSAWAAELDLMAPELVAKINSELSSQAVRQLRCITASKTSQM